MVHDMTKFAFVRFDKLPPNVDGVVCSTIRASIRAHANVVILQDYLSEFEERSLLNFSEKEWEPLWVIISLKKHKLPQNILELLGFNFVAYRSDINLDCAMELARDFHQKKMQDFEAFENCAELTHVWASSFPT